MRYNATVLPIASSALLIACTYDPTDLAWCSMADIAVVGWLADTGDAMAPGSPVILGTMPPAAPDTTPVLSPLWAMREGPDWLWYASPGVTFSGTVHQLLDFLATNNGATRQLYGDFLDPVLAVSWTEWAAGNPSLALDMPPQ
jgi:hypothetical protein